MLRLSHMATAATLALAFAGGNAMAAAKCNIVGTFTDTLGSTGKFVTEKKGTVTNKTVCPQSYNLTVTKLTNLVVDIKGKPKGTSSCGALTGSFMFQNGGCTTASGTVTIQGIGTLNDTITKTGSKVPAKSADRSDLLNGLK